MTSVFAKTNMYWFVDPQQVIVEERKKASKREDGGIWMERGKRERVKEKGKERKEDGGR